MLKPCVANLQLKNLPEEVHEALRNVAARERTTISAIVLSAIERELVRKAWLASFKQRAPSDLGMLSAELLEEARAERGA